MCYRVVTYTLRCDVRPLISDGETLIVDPYATPNTCACPVNLQVKPWFRCDEHGCCMVTGKMHRCSQPETCEIIVYHQYEQTQVQNAIFCQGWHGSMLPRLCEKWDLPKAAPWPVIPILHPISPSITSHPCVMRSLTNVRAAGRLVRATQLYMADLLVELAQRRTDHNAEHGACERVLNSWECEELGAMATLEALLAMYARIQKKQANLFRACCGLLAMLEDGMGGMGQDVVKGLVMEEMEILGRDEAEGRSLSV
ncbi:hypothetical protein G7046_g7157 [Stylonectria norvegica]|nr:hypothetical protein G7046_g7157 [Stylonectria norvegica]